MSSPKLHTVAPILVVKDIVRAAEHYRDTLGFRFDRYWGDPPNFCMVWRDKLCVMLASSDESDGYTPSSKAAPFTWDAYFWVDDADALYEEFKSKGAEFKYAPVDKGYGMREFVAWDLDGHQLAFGHDTDGEGA